MLLILQVNIRFLQEIGYFPSDIGGIDPDRFHDVAGPLGVRMITVGVLLLERHDVLEIAGVVPKGSERDALSRLAYPFGSFFLVLGLFLECAIEQMHLPARLLDPSVGFTIVVLGVACDRGDQPAGRAADAVDPGAALAAVAGSLTG